MSNKLVIGVAILALLIGSYAAGRHIPVIQEFLDAIPVGATSIQVTDGDCLLSPAGTHICTYSRKFIAGTSTPFGVQGPNATSTLVANMSYCTVNTATSSATQYAWSKAATRYASTTVLSTNLVAASVKSAQIMSTTTLGSQTGPSITPLPYQGNLEVGPNQFVNVTLAGALAPAEALTGSSAAALPGLATCVATLVY